MKLKLDWDLSMVGQVAPIYIWMACTVHMRGKCRCRRILHGFACACSGHLTGSPMILWCTCVLGLMACDERAQHCMLRYSYTCDIVQ